MNANLRNPVAGVSLGLLPAAFIFLLLAFLLCPRASGQHPLPVKTDQVADEERPQIPGGLEIRSESSAQHVWAEVSGPLRSSFEELAGALTDPASWCEFLLLHLNTKACIHGSVDGITFLVLYSGRKHYERPEDASRLDYRFTAERTLGSPLRVTLGAEKGPMGTREHRIEVEAAPVPEGTAVRVRCSYAPSTLSRVGTALYLSTLGRGKVGFSRVEGPDSTDGEPVDGVRGIIERNAVRYFLAMEAFLQARMVPPEERFEATLHSWFDMTARYPQLEEMSRTEYLDSKRREHLDQRRLQRTLETAGPGALPGAP